MKIVAIIILMVLAIVCCIGGIAEWDDDRRLAENLFTVVFLSIVGICVYFVFA